MRYAGEKLRHLAVPLGGVGAGHVSLCGDGGLRQWQLSNVVNHTGFVPNSFFAIRASGSRPPSNRVAILQSEEALQLTRVQTPSVNDDFVPAEQRLLVDRFGGVERTVATVKYPFVRIDYEDSRLPVRVSLEAHTPFVPLDSVASGLPAAVFAFTVTNSVDAAVTGCLAAALQNCVGWDGLSPIEGNRNPLLGGNVNRVSFQPGIVQVAMDNPSLPDDHPGQGAMVLASLESGARPFERWRSAAELVAWLADSDFGNRRHYSSGFDFWRQRGHENERGVPVGPSPPGETWAAGLGVPFHLDVGEAVTIRFVFSWHFPNRFVNWDRLDWDEVGVPRAVGRSKFWLGNFYEREGQSAASVVAAVAADGPRLEEQSRGFAELLGLDGTPPGVEELAGQQMATIRSPLAFRAGDGNFYAFEGGAGASTSHAFGHGGSCALNCTHVWNYEHALAKVFPDLERSMRDTELTVMLDSDGCLPHRLVLPVYLPQYRKESIYGPTKPALDGMLGCILKTCREVQEGAGLDWLALRWPAVKRLLGYVIATWDADHDGVLTGEQPNTYDIAFLGPNMHIGGLWLAALRAGRRLAGWMLDDETVDRLGALFELGSSAYDRLLWNGEYYVQELAGVSDLKHQYGTGCLSDQLVGQWWAHQLDLGHLLPQEHIRTTLLSILRHNYRDGFGDSSHRDRVFASGDESGLLNCTWPLGGRPAEPVSYADEVWTGVEYQVSAHCIREGLVAQGLRILSGIQGRYDGERRNPYNQVECGDHYARSLAGWSVIEALSGWNYSAVDQHLGLRTPADGQNVSLPWVSGGGYGSIAFEPRGGSGHIRLRCTGGALALSTLAVEATGSVVAGLTMGSRPIPGQLADFHGKPCFVASESIRLTQGGELEAILSPT